MPLAIELFIDGGMYILAAKGNSYAKKVLINFFVEHVEHEVAPPPELLQFVAEFLMAERPNIRNSKGFHENRWAACDHSDIGPCEAGKASQPLKTNGRASVRLAHQQ